MTEVKKTVLALLDADPKHVRVMQVHGHGPIRGPGFIPNVDAFILENLVVPSRGNCPGIPGPFGRGEVGAKSFNWKITSRFGASVIPSS